MATKDKKANVELKVPPMKSPNSLIGFSVSIRPAVNSKPMQKINRYKTVDARSTFGRCFASVVWDVFFKKEDRDFALTSNKIAKQKNVYAKMYDI